MTNQERDSFIMEKLNEGVSLSDVQKLLEGEYGLRMTYFELRMLAADLQVNWEKQDKPKPAPAVAPPAAAPTAVPAPQEEADALDGDANETEQTLDDETGDESGEEAGEDSTEAPAVGETSIELDEPPLQGTAASGTVTFVSGNSGKWALTHDGRFGFEPAEGSEQPSDEDFALFREALRRKLTGEDEPEDPNAGPTTVDLDAVMRPGVRLSGTVTFSSGASGKWWIDRRGQLEFDLDEGSTRPTRRDVVKFQRELQQVLAKKGY